MIRLHRRELLAAGTFGLGALAAPGTAQILAARGFTHNVASGEPGHYKAMLWTRYVPAAGDSARLEYQVSETLDFTRTLSGGTVTAEAAHDWCVKPVVVGGKIEIRKRMNLSLSCDHRVVDGWDAANFMQDLKKVIESPLKLLSMG